MEIEFSSLAILVSIFIFLITLLTLTKSLSKTKSNSPPGPRKVPFIGHLHLFASAYPPHRVLYDLSLKYGSLMQLQLGEITTLVSSSPESAKEFLKTHDESFAFRPSLLASDIICYGSTDIAFAPCGEYWRQLRKICAIEVLSMKRVQSFRPIREEEFSQLCTKIASDAGSPVNLSEMFVFTNYEIVTRASLGKKTKEQDTFVSVMREVIEMASGFDIGDLYPSVKLFQLFSGQRGKLEKLHKKMDLIMGNIINEHRVARAAKGTGESNSSHEDLLHVLLKYQDADSELHLTTDNIKAILVDMFTAGSETSSTTTEWAMSEMLKHPNVLKKAQDEVRNVFKEKQYVDESYLDELKYLRLVIKETLRLHPPVPLLLPRESSKPCEIDGFKLPAKTRVLVNAWAIGRDPKYWKEAESFKPERYIEKLVDYRGNNLEYIPFGAGKRICPGTSFGLANVDLPLAMLLFHFDWVLPNGMTPEEINMTESFGATSRRKNPLCVIPVVVKPLPAK